MLGINALSKLIDSMKNNKVQNYVIPGLASSLIGGGGHGTVRLFEQGREHEEPIVPHSHRFNFICLVLEGKVKNRVWSQVDPQDWGSKGDTYLLQTLAHFQGFGTQVKLNSGKEVRMSYIDSAYGPGQFYGMQADELHSIYFGKGAKVLFFEGPSIKNTSEIIEPIVDGKVVPTFRVDEWMFRRE